MLPSIGKEIHLSVGTSLLAVGAGRQSRRADEGHDEL
jgi:hypothetical protein